MNKVLLRAYLGLFSLGLSPAALRSSPPTDDWMSGFRPPVVVEPEIPTRTARVTEFGAVPDGRTLCTTAIAKGIASLASQGGGRLVFPAGIWPTGPIVMKSNIALHTEEGALIQFSNDHSLFSAPGLIHGENLENIAITGPGIIDGAGEAWRHVKKGKLTESQWKTMTAKGGRFADKGQTWYPRASEDTWRPRLLVLRNCTRVLLEGTTFQNSPEWNLHPHNCDDLTIRNIIVCNPWYSQNGDGLDLDACRNVIVRGARLDVGDDALCLKSGKGPDAWKVGRACENIFIEDCIVYHGHGGFVIGSEMSGGVRNVRINNCVFIGTDIGLRFKTQRGRGGVVENVYVSNIRMTNIPTDAISFNMYYGGASPDEEKDFTGESRAMAVDQGTPQFRNIFIQDVQCRGARRAVQLQGLPEMPLRGIHLRRVAISATRGVVCQDAQDITLEGLEILNTQGSVVEVIRSRGITIDRLTYNPGADSLFKLSGQDTAGIFLKNTETKPAKQAVILSAGATIGALQLR